VKILAILVGKE